MRITIMGYEVFALRSCSGLTKLPRRERTARTSSFLKRSGGALDEDESCNRDASVCEREDRLRWLSAPVGGGEVLMVIMEKNGRLISRFRFHEESTIVILRESGGGGGVAKL